LLNQIAPEQPAAAPRGLPEAQARVPDPLDRRGIRYPLVPVPALAVCAMLFDRALVRGDR